MTDDNIAQRWASEIGLATAPLFDGAHGSEDSHLVMLDGGLGSFAMSVTHRELWRDDPIADWAWSSDLPHHVAVTEKVVAVTRWDTKRTELLTRSSVEARIGEFYDFLIADRVRASYRVVDHALSLFRRSRTLVSEAGLQDSMAVQAFLEILTELTERADDKIGRGPRDEPGTTDEKELLRQLPPAALDQLIDDYLELSSIVNRRLFPDLAIRHAGSEIFQEAHFELLRAPTVDLFGYAGPAVSKPVTRGGAHFTPPAIARSVAEEVLKGIENLSARTELTILDPACGSGAFLHEALRTLQRLGYRGRLTLVGRDISPAAVAMAKYVVRAAVVDWEPVGGIQVDISIGDSLTDDMGAPDVVLMNPPFVSWAALDERSRTKMREILGGQLQGRADLSMAFVSRALAALGPNGVIGTLLPASLLSLKAAEIWRRGLQENGDVRLLASLGEYGLFTRAQVQVAALVIRKSTTPREDKRTTVLVVGNSSEATGRALRELRKLRPTDTEERVTQDVSLFRIDTRNFAERPTWRIAPASVENSLRRLRDRGVPTIGELFEVRQGIRTGDNSAFVLSSAEYMKLPKGERSFFRPAIMNDSIADGKVHDKYWLFYPYDKNGPLVQEESQLVARLPKYAEEYLLPRKESLAARASLATGTQSAWWLLSRERLSWLSEARSHIVSKYFGGIGGFAVNSGAEYVTVQGFAWLLKSEAIVNDDKALSVDDILSAYSALLNSQTFFGLLQYFSPHVAGGQFDLSPRYVNDVPLPSLSEEANDLKIGSAFEELTRLGRNPSPGSDVWRASVDRAADFVYGTRFSER